MTKNIIVVGASDKADRYSYQAVELLTEKGYNAIPVHPKLQEVQGIKVHSSLEGLSNIDTISLYINPQLSSPMLEQIIQIKPQRVIFNPGSENPELISKLEKAGIKTIEACTLVMLRTGQF